jgi:Tyrosine-protein kinase ephrin type A/B receptor-like
MVCFVFLSWCVFSFWVSSASAKLNCLRRLRALVALLGSFWTPLVRYGGRFLAARSLSLVGYAKCTACPVGSYSERKGAANCEVCPEGEYSPAGSRQCGKYAAGSYGTANRELGASSLGSCKTCTAGFYSNAGSDSCVASLGGTYSVVEGATDRSYCSNCSPGTFSSTTGADSNATCAACPIGTYSNSTVGYASCAGCPRGSYSPVEGAPYCLTCPAGSTSTEGSSVCKCTQGYKWVPGVVEKFWSSEAAGAVAGNCQVAMFSKF